MSSTVVIPYRSLCGRATRIRRTHRTKRKITGSAYPRISEGIEPTEKRRGLAIAACPYSRTQGIPSTPRQVAVQQCHP